jgi:hypothetical protein
MDKKIKKLLRLLMTVYNLPMEQMTENIIRIGLEHIHPYMERYLNGDYEDIAFDAESGTWRLHITQNNFKQITELEREKWIKPLHYHRKKRGGKAS